MKRIVICLAAILALAGCSTSHPQSMQQSYAYRYGQVTGEMTYMMAVAQEGKTAAAALCQDYAGQITSKFVPASDLVEFPQWRKKGVKSHLWWFFLGLKAGCSTP
jgi:hypothetical protein